MATYGYLALASALIVAVLTFFIVLKPLNSIKSKPFSGRQSRVVNVDFELLGTIPFILFFVVLFTTRHRR